MTDTIIQPADSVADERAEYTAGLRALADLLDASPRLRLPYSGIASPLLVMTMSGGDQRRECADWVRVLQDGQKSVRGDAFDVQGRLRGLHICVIANRDKVCTRRVVGTEQVTRTVPDPAAPPVEVTETVERVEWDCQPLLRPVSA